MEFRPSCSIPTGCCSRSVIECLRARSIRAAMTFSRPRPGSRASWPIAKGDAPARHWFRLSHAVIPVRQRRGADFVVRLDSVRIPDAIAGHESADRESDRADQQADSPPPNRVRGDAEDALGRIGVRLQRARPAAHLPILQLRGSRARPKARVGRQRRGRSVRHRPGEHGRPSGCGAEFRASGWNWRSPGRYGFYEALDFTPGRVPKRGTRGRRQGPS